MPRFDRLELDDPAPDGDRGPAKDPARDHEHWLAQADRERRQGHYETALRLYSRALEDDKSVIAAWVGQVRMLVHLGEYAEAELWARKALEIFKNNPDLLAGRAQAFCRLGDKKQAMGCCDQALAQAGETAYRWLVRGELMVADKQALDRHCFDKAVAADKDWLVQAEIGLVLQYYGQPGKALPRFKAALEEEPESVFLWLKRAECEDALGLTDAAVTSLRRALEIVPKHDEARAKLNALLDRPGLFGRIRNFLGL
ncbi:MAG: tetratricopeptide repeat protein [Gemmataceae bacterium]|nr:tetratricopeptide repeat protein [Gemmataceae bacterium]